jgi:putative nucleotidyltransferase with HDIG domain
VHHRLRQGLRAIRAWFRKPDISQAGLYLSPPLMGVFGMLRPGEAQHSLHVLETLIHMGESNPSLLVAALLHDVGKARFPYTLPERVIVVLTRKFFPALAERWGNGDPNTWRRPFVISRQHPTWSAEIVSRAGADPLAIELIAAHQRKLDHAPHDETERLLVALQAADDEN